MSAEFFEKVLLLAITALLTGFGAPVVLRFVDERRSRAQKLLEADNRKLYTVREFQRSFAVDVVIDDFPGGGNTDPGPDPTAPNTP